MKSRKGGRRVAAAVATAVLLLLAGACGGQAKPKAVAKVSPTSTTTATSAPTTTRRGTTHKAQPKASRPKQKIHHSVRKVHRAKLCPLTGLPAPHGHLRERAALAVKVENLPVSRPPYGIDKADIVFEEPVEGGITRFVAVFQCHGADRIEPIRSARLVDPKILEPLGHMLIAYSGAIQPAVSDIDSPRSILCDVGAYKAPGAYWRDPDREAPHNFASSTKALYAAAGALHCPEKPPTPIFSYGRPVQGGHPAASVSLTDPIDTTTWTWDKHTRVYDRSYSDTGPAVTGEGTLITASNIVIMFVVERPTPYIEDDTGAHENDLALKGHGPAMIIRDGMVFYGKWERPKLDDPAVFYDTKSGDKIKLTPGNTWEELVPYGERVTVTP